MNVSYVSQIKNTTFKTFSSFRPPLAENKQKSQKNINHPSISHTIYDIEISKDDSIKFALLKLKEIKFDPKDAEYVKNLGINLPLENGQQAYDMLKNNNIKVEYAKVSDPSIHAQWINEDNKIIINEKYKDTKNLAEILAISEALMHEIGHAKDKDYLSSMQEELECLALNALSYRYHLKYYPNILKNSDADIIKDGVELYSNLFFDKDPYKKALSKRINEKYGSLPLVSPNHKTTSFIVKNTIYN